NSCSFTVTVRDGSPPSIVAPASLITNTSPGKCFATNFDLGSPTVSDNCGTVTISNNAPAQFPKGATIVTWTARDSSGNTNSATQTVTIRDAEVPVFSGCPTNIDVAAPSNQCSAIVSWSAPSATDNCAVTNTSSNHSPGESFPVGTTLVTYVALDNSGNSN